MMLSANSDLIRGQCTLSNIAFPVSSDQVMHFVGPKPAPRSEFPNLAAALTSGHNFGALLSLKLCFVHALSAYFPTLRFRLREH
jgi:hypothetical protein